MEWDRGEMPPHNKHVAIGWHELGNLSRLVATREAFKNEFARAFPDEKAGAIPVKAGVLFRFCIQMKRGDVVVYPSKFDKMVNIGVVVSDYIFSGGPGDEHPNRRQVDWKAHLPRAQFSQQALYEIGSAITLFQINNNTEEFLAALDGEPIGPQGMETDATVAADVASQTEESVEDFIIKRLDSGISSRQFEEFIGGLLRAMGYFARVTQYSGDGGVDIIAHRDELGFEPPIIKVQCKQTLSTISGPDVQQLLGAIQDREFALFVTLGTYSAQARYIERNNGKLRLLGGVELVQMIFGSYDKLEPQLKALLPLKRSYAPSV